MEFDEPRWILGRPLMNWTHSRNDLMWVGFEVRFNSKFIILESQQQLVYSVFIICCSHMALVTKPHLDNGVISRLL